MQNSSKALTLLVNVKKNNLQTENYPGILSCLKSGKLDFYLFMPCFVVQVMWTWWTGCSWMLASPRSWSRSGKIMNCSKWSTEKKKRKKITVRSKLPCFKKWTQMVQVFLRHRYLSCTFQFVFFWFIALSSLLVRSTVLARFVATDGGITRVYPKRYLLVYRRGGGLDLEAWEGADSMFGIIA